MTQTRFSGPGASNARGSGFSSVAAITALLLLTCEVPKAWAGCNVIPAGTRDFRAAIGSVNRPFAGPGDYVEVRLRPGVCGADATIRYVDLDSDGELNDDYMVTVLFVPASADATAIILAEDCAGLDLAGCEAEPAVGRAECREVNALGEAVGLAVDETSKTELQFRFPDTDDIFADLNDPKTADDDRTLAGPMTIVVTRRDAALPCQLADPSQRCADISVGTAGILACVDELFELDGTCRTQPENRNPTFGHFTALPPPNKFEAMVTDPGLTEVRFTTDQAGNVLAPVDWAGVILRLEGVPISRLVRIDTSFRAFSEAEAPIDIPADSFLASYSPEGVILPPVFSPLSDPTDLNNTILFGSTDATRSVIRIARRGCVGGEDEGEPCTSKDDCFSAICGELFDYGDRFEDGAGPVVVSPDEYTAQSETPVPLEGLLEGEDTFVFVLSEAIDGSDLNGDGDATDFVVTLRDRDTGIATLMGSQDPNVLATPGRATPRVRQLPFAFPPVATEGDLVAFLEGEPLQGNQDSNEDGDIFDTILRVFQLGSSVEVTENLNNLAVDAAPVVNGRSLVFSDGLLFYRVPEWVNARQTTIRASEPAGLDPNDPNGESRDAAISRDGSTVAFRSAAGNLVPGDSNGFDDIFVRDLTTDAILLVLVSSDPNGDPANGPSFSPAISKDGSSVAFESDADNLLIGPTDTNALLDIFVRDLVSETTVRASLSDGGSEITGFLFPPLDPDISADGTVVAFFSENDGLVGPSSGDIFVRDLEAGTTTRASISTLGVPGNGLSFNSTLSGDGRFVAFGSFATNLIDGTPLSIGHVYLRDRVLGITEFISVNSDGEEENSFSFSPHISDDGQIVAFESVSNDLVAGDTNSVADVFVRDRRSGITLRASVASNGAQAEFETTASEISSDGRFVAFETFSMNLVPDDDEDSDADIFLHDLLTGLTQKLSLAFDNTDGVGSSVNPSVSEDGRFVAFESVAKNLVPNDSNLIQDVFVRGPDDADSDNEFDETRDGDLADTLLEVLDLRVRPPLRIPLGPAEQVVVAGGRAAFLFPEDAIGAGSDLNNDPNSDTDDLVVHLWERTCLGGASVDKVCANDDDCPLSMCAVPGSGAVENLEMAAVAIAISLEKLVALVPEAGQGDGPLNGDADEDDEVVQVYDETWTNLGVAADTIAVSGATVAMLVPEAGQGDGPLNGDGDLDDRVLHVWDPNTLLINLGQAAEEFVLGDSLLAFRTAESAQNNQPLNGDGDLNDFVLQVYDLTSRELINSGQAAIPCRLLACDPRHPYRVSKDTVRFLTLESDQDEDLNDDGDKDDLLIQLFNASSRETVVIGEVFDTGATVQDGVPSGDPLADPTGTDEDGGSQAFLSKGRCVEETSVPCPGGDSDCEAGQFCIDDPNDPALCAIEHGTCETVDDCPPDTPCRDDLVVTTTFDTDGDEVPDALDNCPDAANVDQLDSDLDDVGDVCDLETCGNGSTELDEECDDGDLIDGNECDSNCRTTACGNAIQTAGEDCDDGNTQDGDGCSSSCQLEGGFACEGELSFCDPIIEQEQTKDQQNCINALNQNGAKVAKTQNQENAKCVRDAGVGTVADAQACLSADLGGMVALAKQMTIDQEAAKCVAPLPDFGVTSSGVVNQAAVDEALGITSDLFGSNLTAAIVPKGLDRVGAMCQAEIIKHTNKVLDTKWQLALMGKKNALKGKDVPQVRSSQALGLAVLGFVEADANGLVQKVERKLAQMASARCRGAVTPIATLFPGVCSESANLAELAACAARAAECRFCRALNAFDAFAADCDDFDNGLGDGSCP